VANLADIPETSLNLERARSRQNVPQRYTLSFISEIPRSVRILHDFKFSSLLSLESGQPFNIFAGSDANRDGNPLSDRPSNLGRNTLTGPGYASFDVRVARTIHIKERLRAELSGDMFNMFNRTNIKDLNTLYGGTDITLPPNPLLGFGTPATRITRSNSSSELNSASKTIASQQKPATTVAGFAFGQDEACHRKSFLFLGTKGNSPFSR